MPVLTQPATSTQPVQQQVIPPVGVNPTSDTVEMAFIPQPASGPLPNPTTGQWNAATWVTDSGPSYWASCLVGPANGGVVLAAGAYAIAVQVTDNPAVPVLWGLDLLIT